ncbi:MAG: glycosyltransferase family 2 protein [Brumimicrobium sp.]|nr:glycosyltransferase family 2 protein [Brumimicrobium sp.]
MKEIPRFSVVIPCFNAEKYIEQTINSALNNSLKNVELIVVNDGSSDSSRRIVENIKDERLQIINTENRGVSAARNTGLQKSTGDFVLFLDSDDLISENYFESASQKFQSNAIDFCTFPILRIDENNRPLDNEPLFRGTYSNMAEEIALFYSNISACPSAYIYRRQSLITHGISFNEVLKSPEDRFFLLQAAPCLKGCLVTEGLLKYRVTEKSLSNNKNPALIGMQETFFLEVNRHDLIKDRRLKKGFNRKLAYQLLIDFFRLRVYRKSAKYLIIYLIPSLANKARPNMGGNN